VTDTTVISNLLPFLPRGFHATRQGSKRASDYKVRYTWIVNGSSGQAAARNEAQHRQYAHERRLEISLTQAPVPGPRVCPCPAHTVQASDQHTWRWCSSAEVAVRGQVDLGLDLDMNRFDAVKGLDQRRSQLHDAMNPLPSAGGRHRTQAPGSGLASWRERRPGN